MKLRGIRKHLTYANVMATLAVFIVLGGGAYAATKLPKNSVGTKQLKKGAVTSAKVKKGAITSAKVKKGAITSAKVKKGSLLASNFKAGQLPKGATGSAGATGPTGTTGAEGGPNAVAEAAGGDGPPDPVQGLAEQEEHAADMVEDLEDAPADELERSDHQEPEGASRTAFGAGGVGHEGSAPGLSPGRRHPEK